MSGDAGSPARLTDDQVDELVRLAGAIADDDPYALDALVGTVESWLAAHDAAIRAEATARASRMHHRAQVAEAARDRAIYERDWWKATTSRVIAENQRLTGTDGETLRAAQPTEGES